MSKSLLKKELGLMSKEQVVQVLLDAYSATPEFKEYFEFFLNPDVERLKEKHDAAITKELGRVKWGYSKARTSVLKKAVKKFIGFNPGPEHVLDMLFMTLRRLGQTERYVNFKENMMNYVVFVTKQIVSTANDGELFADAIKRLKEETKSPAYTTYFRRHIAKGIET